MRSDETIERRASHDNDTTEKDPAFMQHKSSNDATAPEPLHQSTFTVTGANETPDLMPITLAHGTATREGGSSHNNDT